MIFSLLMDCFLKKLCLICGDQVYIKSMYMSIEIKFSALEWNWPFLYDMGTNSLRELFPRNLADHSILHRGSLGSSHNLPPQRTSAETDSTFLSFLS